MLVSAWSFNSYAQNRVYRYIDGNGQTVIRSSISPENVALGYDILDDNGRLIETVAPVEDNASEKYQQRELAKKKQQQQDEYDLSLIRRYSFVTDIEVERDRKLTELKVRMAILKGNLNSVRTELETAYEEAATRERKGNKVDDALQKRINGLEQKISSTEDILQKRQHEMELLQNEYVRTIERFIEIQTLRGR